MNGPGSPASRGARTDAVSRTLHDLMKRVIHSVKFSGTRLAAYLRGWQTFHAFSAGSVQEPPACKPCIIAANHRGTKEVPPPRLGLFPCLPLPEEAGSLEDRYINFVLGVSSFVAVGGQPVPLAAFRRPTSKEHVALIQHLRRQWGAFEEACDGLDPEETLGSIWKVWSQCKLRDNRCKKFVLTCSYQEPVFHSISSSSLSSQSPIPYPKRQSSLEIIDTRPASSLPMQAVYADFQIRFRDGAASCGSR